VLLFGDLGLGRLGGVEGAESPPLALLARRAVFHRQLVLGRRDGQALLTAAVPKRARLKSVESVKSTVLGAFANSTHFVVVHPELVAPGTVTRVKDDVRTGVVQARLVSPYLALFG